MMLYVPGSCKINQKLIKQLQDFDLPREKTVNKFQEVAILCYLQAPPLSLWAIQLH